MDTPLVKRAYNLGLKAVPNFLSLTEDQITYYEQHLDELPIAVNRGFSIPSIKTSIQTQPIAVLLPTLFKTADTDLDGWLRTAEDFAKKYLGVEVNLREKFAIPEEIPWKSVIPVFDPGGLSNREALKKVLKMLGPNKPYEEVDIMKYSGSEAGSAPTLHLIENSVRPNIDTMGMSPDSLLATGKSWLRLRGYTLAFALYHLVTNGYLDPETWTWFPADRLAPSGHVARGYWAPVSSRVWFYWNNSGYEYGSMGARLAIPVSLKP